MMLIIGCALILGVKLGAMMELLKSEEELMKLGAKKTFSQFSFSVREVKSLIVKPESVYDASSEYKDKPGGRRMYALPDLE